MPPVLASPYYTSEVTPALQIHPHHSSPTCVRPPLAEPAVLSGVPRRRTTRFRDGLPTPPSDMTGIVYNAASSSHVGQYDPTSLCFYSSLQRNRTFTSSVAPPAKPQMDMSSTGSTLISVPASQKQPSGSSVSPISQISPVRGGSGSLAEFAAQMTCLFWFESSTKLAVIESGRDSFALLSPDSIPSPGFQKWVSNILSTTQVGQNVVLLAILFIYRLKKFNPSVRGKRGSEFRLMTIALMLGNKFLDDNTYTNKTWAEVSGISDQEIHVMEVEFLSNVRYNLFASETEWANWKVMLGRFSNYFNRASVSENDMALSLPTLRNSPGLAPTLRVQSSSPLSKLPSPPISAAVRGQQALSRQLCLGDISGNLRKRGYDEPEDRPAKRLAASGAVAMPIPSLPPASVLADISTLPPVLTSIPAPSDGSISCMGPRLPWPSFQVSQDVLAPSIPISVPHSPTARGIPGYSSAPNWAPTVPPSIGTLPSNGSYSGAVSLPNPAMQSPLGIPSRDVSPAASTYSAHTPQTRFSPSFFLANRYSPYRPVRAVSALLVPPPGSIQQQRAIPFENMHYQPLGRPATERKTGPLPYAQREPWLRGPLVQPMFQTNHTYSD